jgi:hypothetical protein
MITIYDVDDPSYYTYQYVINHEKAVDYQFQC